MLSNIEEESADDARRILSLLCTARRPLTVRELIDGIAVELGDHPRFNADSRLMNEEDIRRICPGFIELDPHPADNRTIVRIAHYSVQEYLESDRIQTGVAARFSVRRQETHTEVAAICLAYLMDSGLCDASLGENESFYEAFPFSAYAAQTWPEHYRQGNSLDPCLHRLVVELFRKDQPALAIWVNISHRNNYKVGGSLRYRIPLSSLYLAAHQGLDPVVRILLANGSHFLPRDKRRYGSALRAAAAAGHVSTVRLLMDHGAEINDSDLNGVPLALASAFGHTEVVKTLLDRGANIEIQDNRGIRPLHSSVSSKRGNVDVVRLLLDRGADINAPNWPETCPEPVTPTSSTIRGKAVGMHLGRGINATGGRDWSHLAAESVKLLEALLDDFGADIYLGRLGTPSEMACLGGNASIVEYLFNRGADVDQAGGYPHLLECAAFEGNAEVV
jgi:ankyrin repeat protein